MKLIYLLTAVFPIVFLTGCQDMVEGGQDLSHSVRNDVISTARDVRDVFKYQRRPDPEVAAIPYIFCYQVMQDIICYDTPQSGKEGKLVGWQGRPAPEYIISNNNTAPVAPVTIVRPSASNHSSSQLEPLTPVYVNAPTPVKEEGMTVKIKENQDGALY